MKDENGSDSLAVQLVDEKHWDELVIIIAVVCYYFSYVWFIIALDYQKKKTEKRFLGSKKTDPSVLCSQIQTEEIFQLVNRWVNVLLLFLCCLKGDFLHLYCVFVFLLQSNLWLIYEDRNSVPPFMLLVCLPKNFIYSVLFCP